MALPKKLKKFNFFDEGHSYLGVAEEITLPTLGWSSEEFEGAGMVGPVDIPMSLEKLEAQWTLGGLEAQVLRQFGICGLAGIGLRFNGSYQDAQTCEVLPVEVTMRGYHRQIDMGNAKQGDNTQHQITSALSYYKLIVNGETLIEIDVINQVFVVDGEDKYAEHRKAMGL
ncbi:phage major tail tube protein [Guyparkeria sp. GHLCS8-2]|uniref:phage major tail tube protein n=1 Tax=Guyparkeria halopsychrophila TaxID=3139421 RepID=UPI0037CB457B